MSIFSHTKNVSFEPDGSCTDNSNKCPGYAAAPQKYCEKYKWVKKNCKKSCQLCEGKDIHISISICFFTFFQKDFSKNFSYSRLSNKHSQTSVAYQINVALEKFQVFNKHSPFNGQFLACKSKSFKSTLYLLSSSFNFNNERYYFFFHVPYKQKKLWSSGES